MPETKTVDSISDFATLTHVGRIKGLKKMTRTSDMKRQTKAFKRKTQTKPGRQVQSASEDKLTEKGSEARPTRNLKLKRRRAPRTVDDFSALSDQAREQWNRVAHVIQKVRSERISVTQAAKEFQIDRKKVIELGGSALRKQKNGRYEAKSFDRLLRVLVIPSSDGMKEVAIRDSRTASKIAEYSAAVRKFLYTGDQSKLRPFKRLRINDAEGNPIKLLTNGQQLTHLGSAGVLSFESLYARVA
jgi:hypothetical protein